MNSKEMEIVLILLVALVGVSSAGGSELRHKRMTNPDSVVKRESPKLGVDVYAGLNTVNLIFNKL